MTDLRKAAQQALEALSDCIEKFYAMRSIGVIDALPLQAVSGAQAITALRAALAQPDVQEPVTKTGKAYVDNLIDALLLPIAAMTASDLEELHCRCADMLLMYATPALAQPDVPGGWVPPAGMKVADVGFVWDGELQTHTPKVVVHFEPVPANTPCDAKGWSDRDAFVAMLAAAPKGGA